MSRDVRLYLEDIREGCEKVRRFTAEMGVDEFVEDARTYDAVLWNLAVIGEAAKEVPDDIRERHDSVEWRKIAGLRDVLVHAYFGLEDETLWDISRTRSPSSA